MGSASSSRCASCHNGDLRPTRLRITLTYDGQSHAVDDDALVCAACGDELIGERATGTRRTEIVYAANCGCSARFHIAVTIQRLTPADASPWRNDCTVAVVQEVQEVRAERAR
jgi:YgiT-type zinc finger domain-containing protein